MNKQSIRTSAAALASVIFLAACAPATSDKASGGPSGFGPSTRWEQVGSPPTTSDNKYESTAFSPDGTFHLLFWDARSSQSPTLVRYLSDGWDQVGGDGVARQNSLWQDLAFDSAGTPYIAVCEPGYTNPQNKTKVSVMKFGGTTWSYVGDAGGVSDEGAAYVSMVFDSHDIPYVAYLDYSNDASKATVKKFVDGAWELVGSAQFTGTIPGPGAYEDSQELSLAIAPDDTLYLAYRLEVNTETTANVVSVAKYTGTGTGWEELGEPGEASGGADAGRWVSLAIASDGTPFVAYSDVDNNGKAGVRRYLGGWSQVGTAAFTAGQAGFVSLAVDAEGKPFVAYEDVVSGSRPTVNTFNASGWVQVGSISDMGSTYLSLSLDAQGTPYLAYRESGSAAALVKKAVP